MRFSSIVFKAAILLGLAAAGPANATENLRVYAAGSTKKAFTEVGRAFSAREGIAVDFTFGASGLLLDRLRGGEAADVFASADLPKAQALHAAGLSARPVVMARSRLCVLTRAGLMVTPQSLLDVISNPTVKILAPAPEVDATGYYVWGVYKRAEKIRRGSYRLLDEKTVRLDVKNMPAVPAGKSVLPIFFEKDMVDLFFAYCNGAAQTVQESPALKVTEIPRTLAVPVAYGITLLGHGNQPAGQKFIDFLMAPQGQAILAKWGFAPP